MQLYGLIASINLQSRTASAARVSLHQQNRKGTMSKTVLCAVDGTSHSDRAIAVAAETALTGGAALDLLLVDQVTVDGRSLPVHKFGEVGAQEVLGQAKKKAAEAGYHNPRLVSIASRDVARAILNYADEHHVEHIVVGTGEKSTATRFIIGSVSHDLVIRAHCSVTVAR